MIVQQCNSCQVWTLCLAQAIPAASGSCVRVLTISPTSSHLSSLFQPPSPTLYTRRLARPLYLDPPSTSYSHRLISPCRQPSPTSPAALCILAISPTLVCDMAISSYPSSRSWASSSEVEVPRVSGEGAETTGDDDDEH